MIIQRISWIWIALGGLMAIAGLFALLASTVMAVFLWDEPLFGVVQGSFAALLGLSVVQTAVGAGAVYSARQLQRRRKRGRAGLEIATWLALALFLVVAFFSIMPLLWMGGPAEFVILQCFMLLVTLAFFAGVIGSLALMLVHLRSPALKEVLH